MNLRYGSLPTTAELEVVKRLLDTLEPGDWTWQLWADPMSPWLCIDCKARAVIDAKNPEPSFALWRETLKVYEVDSNGEAAEDPMELPA